MFSNTYCTFDDSCSAPAFNLDLSAWDVSRVKNMRQMFNSNSQFTNVASLNTWDVRAVTNMANILLSVPPYEPLCGYAWTTSLAAIFKQNGVTPSVNVDSTICACVAGTYYVPGSTQVAAGCYPCTTGQFSLGGYVAGAGVSCSSCQGLAGDVYCSTGGVQVLLQLTFHTKLVLTVQRFCY
jgi:hypothetical protein